MNFVFKIGLVKIVKPFFNLSLFNRLCDYLLGVAQFDMQLAIVYLDIDA